MTGARRRVHRDEAAGPPASVALLAAPRDLVPVGAALAGGIARRSGAGATILATWCAARGRADRLGLPGGPAARRLARRLAAHGVEAVASGRVARLALPDDAAAARAVAGRLAATMPAPIVVALGGPREAQIDALLDEQDLVVLALREDADAGLALLAEESLARRRPPTELCPLPPADASSAFAAAGLQPPGALRAALAPALEVIA